MIKVGVMLEMPNGTTIDDIVDALEAIARTINKEGTAALTKDYTFGANSKYPIGIKIRKA